MATQSTALHINRGSERSYSQRLSHSCRKQSRVCTDEPSQLLVMRSQERPRVWVPLPQVTEHWVHSDQGDQPAPSWSTRETTQDSNTLVMVHWYFKFKTFPLFSCFFWIAKFWQEMWAHFLHSGGSTVPRERWHSGRAPEGRRSSGTQWQSSAEVGDRNAKHKMKHPATGNVNADTDKLAPPAAALTEPMNHSRLLTQQTEFLTGHDSHVWELF